MTEVRTVAGVATDGVKEFDKILFSLSQQDVPPNERVRAYILLQEILKISDCQKLNRRIESYMSPFCKCIQRDVVSQNENITVLALKTLGYLIHRREFVYKLPEDEACKFLLTLLAIITTSSKKVCVTGLWCLSIQDFKTSVTKMHLKMIIDVVMHGIDNPEGSVGITYEACQALVRLTIQLPSEMREASWAWAPRICQKMLDSKSRIVELSESCLSSVESVLLPPLPRLSEVVAADLQQKLLSKLKSMMELDRHSMCTAIQAWGWFVKLLGSGLAPGEKSPRTNMILPIMETSFISQIPQVRKASQVAWVSLIDTYVPPQSDTAAKVNVEVLAPPTKAGHVCQKHLKLLVMPLLNSMSWEKDLAVQRTCCRTWIYLLCKLGRSVNEGPVFDTAVVPMLEVVFRLSPKERDTHVWQTCVDILMDMISCKRLDESNSGAGDLCVGGLSQSPKTPVGILYSGVFSGAHHKKIKWNPWHIEHLDSMLETVNVLWMHGLEHLKDAEEHATLPSSNLEAACESWHLLVRAVDRGEKNAVRPSGGHVTAVHLLLDLFYGVCCGHPSQQVLSHIWKLAETLIDVLGSVIMVSSFYRISLQDPEPSSCMIEETKQSHPQNDASRLNMVTPIVFLSAVWFKLVFESTVVSQEKKWMPSVERLITAGREGFDAMGNFHGFAWILDHLGKSGCFQEESPSKKNAMMSEIAPTYNWNFLLAVWKLVAEKFKEHVERLNDVPSVAGFECDSGYEVASNILVFPIKCFLLSAFSESEKLTPLLGSIQSEISDAELHRAEGSWLKLYDAVSRISALKNSQPNSFTGRVFNRVAAALKTCLQEQVNRKLEGLSCDSGPSRYCLRLLGTAVAHAMKHVEISNLAMLAISRKRRKTGYGAASVRVQHMAGMELEDANNMKDLLAVASRFLILAHESYMRETRYSDIPEFVNRVLAAFASLAQLITSQNDSILLLQALSHPLSRWFAVDSEGESPQKHVPDTVVEGLARVWDGLLSCLQICRPSLGFDSQLLLAQEPSLARAFEHYDQAISNRTLAFWEATYGIKATTLRYPPGLVGVFTMLKEKVDISLPGWSMRAATATDSCAANGLESFQCKPVPKVSRQLGWRIQNMMKAVDGHGVKVRKDHGTSSVGSQEMNRGTSDRPSVKEPGIQRETPRLELHPLLGTSSEKLECTEDGSADVRSKLKGEFMSTPEGNAAIDALMEDFSVHPNPEDGLDEESPSVVEIPTDIPDPSTAAADASEDSQPLEVPIPMEFANSEINRSSLDSLTDDQQDEKIGDDAERTDGTETLETPPFAVNDTPSIPQRRYLGAERPQAEAAGADVKTHVTVAAADERDKASTEEAAAAAGSKLPRGRKKLKFQDDSQEVENVDISQSQKRKNGPLTLHQTDVRSSQRNGGRVIKTYTRSEFSQGLLGSDSLDLGDSQSPALGQGTAAAQAGADADGKENVKPSSGERSEEVMKKNQGNVNYRESDYSRLKARLKSVFAHDPNLTYRQIFTQEGWEYLPVHVHNRLRSILYRIKCQQRKSAAASKCFEEEPDDEDPLEVVVPRSRSWKRHSGDSGQLRRSVRSRIPHPRKKSNKQEGGITMPSPLCSRPEKDVNGQLQRPVRMGLSSGKTRGGKHWRINFELGSVITARLGIKKIIAKRQRICSNLVSKLQERNSNHTAVDDDHPVGADLTSATNQADCCSQMKKEEAGAIQEESASKTHDEPYPEVKGSEEFSMRGCEASPEMQQPGGPPFRVRDLNRGLLASAYGLSSIGSVDAKEHSVSGCSTSSRSNSRKRRAPKRLPSLGIDGDRMTAKPTCELDESTISGSSQIFLASRNSGDNPPAAPMDDGVETVEHKCSIVERNESGLLVGRRQNEGVAFSQNCSSREGKDIDQIVLNDSNPISRGVTSVEDRPADGMANSCKDFESPPTGAVGFELDSDMCNPKDGLAAHGHQLHDSKTAEGNSQRCLTPQLASHTGKEAVDEVHTLVEREDVQVCQVLAALVASSKWKDMGRTDVIQAEKLLFELRKVVSACRSDDSTFVTPPTHF